MADYTAFEVGISGGVAHVTLNQPDRGNPFDLRFTQEITRIATECDENPEVRCVVIDARGRYFSVGADLRTMVRGRDELNRFIKNATAGLHSALSRFARMDAPVIAVAHALTVGGAVSLCAAADFCLAASSARFYCAYTGIGLVPDGGGTTFLPMRVGSRRATEFFLRNQTWTAQEAQNYGLVNSVHEPDELAGVADSLAAELAGGPTRTFGEIKNLLLSSSNIPIEAQMEQEARAMTRATRTEDAWNAINTVSAKGTPEFRGR